MSFSSVATALYVCLPLNLLQGISAFSLIKAPASIQWIVTAMKLLLLTLHISVGGLGLGHIILGVNLVLELLFALLSKSLANVFLSGSTR